MKQIWNRAIDMPPMWLLAFLLLVWVQADSWNPFGYSAGWSTLLGWLLILTGLALAVWAATLFRAHKTSVIPRKTPSALISRGPYGFSRNPIYLADAVILLGFAILQGSLIGLIAVPLFLAVIQSRFIHGEEAGLRAAFPEEFAAYAARTRRWL